MIGRGLYVDVWREGLKNQTQADELIAFCNAAGITDLFVHMHKDIVSISIDWDYMRYLLDHRGAWKIHGWFSGLQLGSNNAWTSSVYPREITMESQNVIFLDPMVEAARDLLVNKVGDFVSRYPDADGVHLDKMRYPVINGVSPGLGSEEEKEDALNVLMARIRAVVPGTLSIVVTQILKGAHSWPLCDWGKWLASGWVDEMTFVIDQKTQGRCIRKMKTIVPADAAVVVMAYMFSFAKTIETIQDIKATGRGYALFSYGLYAFQDQGRMTLAELLHHDG